MEQHTFTCTATRDDRSWFIQCDQHPAACTTVRILAQAAPQMKRSLAASLAVPEDQVTVDVRPILPAAVTVHLNLAKQLRRTAASANHASAVHTRTAAHILNKNGLSLRDIGTVLGVSHQRAHQLLNPKRGTS
ncbi:hypothetical protein [Phytoactinopolyspora limicola]|uniref:hypothetical protein n=1 Tax=Phytoactinopolyspora limicola TaxID=2715536 RepID=UPI001408056A|nr:hypothetical protein [Phytoactinopolyspora limicola]